MTERGPEMDIKNECIPDHNAKLKLRLIELIGFCTITHRFGQGPMQPCNQSSPSTTAPSVDPPPTNLQERLYTRAEFLNLKILLGQAGVIRSLACVITYPSGLH